jgi:drug/metabolite transporter (DMT)-like permease
LALPFSEKTKKIPPIAKNPDTMTLVNKGILLTILSCFFFSIMALAARFANGYFPTSEVVFARCFVNFCICVAVARYANLKLFAPRFDRYLIIRSLAGFAAVGLYFVSIRYLPLSEAVALYSTSPIFVAIYQILLAQFLKKKTSPKTQMAKTLFLVLLAFTGVVIILKPSGGFFNLNGLIGLLSASCAALAYLTLNQLTKKYRPAIIVGYFTGISSLLLLPFAGSFRMPNNEKQWGVLLVMGISAAIAQSAMTRGYAVLDAVLAAELGNFTIVFSTILGAFVLNENPSPNFYWG